MSHSKTRFTGYAAETITDHREGVREDRCSNCRSVLTAIVTSIISTLKGLDGTIAVHTHEYRRIQPCPVCHTNYSTLRDPLQCFSAKATNTPHSS